MLAAVETGRLDSRISDSSSDVGVRLPAAKVTILVSAVIAAWLGWVAAGLPVLRSALLAPA